MSTHAILSPSSAKRWLYCPGSVALHAQYPDSGSDDAAEGTAAHALGEKCLKEGLNAADLIGMVIPTDRQPFKVDDEMVSEVQKYIDYVRTVQQGCGGELFVEQRLSIAHLTGEEGAEGTSDAVILSADGETLHAIDLKYGKGIRVEAERNEQLAMYASAALRALDIAGTVQRVVMHIVMPRLNHYPTWELPVEVPETPDEQGERPSMVAFEKAVQYHAAKAITFIGKKPEDVGVLDLRPDADACRWCRAKADCPALADQVQEEIGADFANLDEAPKVDEQTDIGEKLDAVELVEMWCKAVRAEAERRLHAGIAVPGYKLVEGKRGARAWTAETEAEEVMKSMRLKQDEMYSFKLISPTQAEKLLKDSPKRWNRLQELVTQKGGNPTVVPESDKRPALVINPVADFADETGGDLV